MSISDESGALDYQRAREAAMAAPAAVADPVSGPALGTLIALGLAALLALAIVGIGRHGDPAPQLQLSLILGAAFGFVIQRSRFCFLCIWRDWLDRRDPRGLLGIVTALAVGITGYTLIFGAWLPDPSGTRLPPTAHIGPVSLALVLAGLAFGAGMALSGSCLSAHLYRLGEGSPTAPFALIGAVGGFILGFQSWNGLYLWTIAGAPVPWLPRHLGYGGALIVSLVVLGALAWLLLRKGNLPPQPEPSRDPLVAMFRQRWPAWLGGLLVGLIGVAAYLRVSPLGVTAEIGSRARQLAGAFALLPSRLEGLPRSTPSTRRISTISPSRTRSRLPNTGGTSTRQALPRCSTMTERSARSIDTTRTLSRSISTGPTPATMTVSLVISG